MKIHYRGAEIRYSAHVYEPSEDTFLLAEAALSEVSRNDHVLEMGCGCGLVSALLRDRCASVLAADLNPHAAACARANGVDSVICDLFSGLKGRFDLIIFNPPYLPTGEHERLGGWLDMAIDGGSDGLAVIGRFISDVRDHLTPGGRLLFLVSTLADTGRVVHALETQGFEVSMVAGERYMFEQLIVLKSAVRT
ncbi:MAG TPA: methyltransferase [Candidatus Methanoperedenaceae archaeon]|nr:methyltransferase [Candidatus Methanoperedenaceae archaeon]